MGRRASYRTQLWRFYFMVTVFTIISCGNESRVDLKKISTFDLSPQERLANSSRSILSDNKNGDSADSNGLTSTGATSKNTELLWINNHPTVPVTVSYINDPSLANRSFNVTPMLESTIYEAWVGALKLLETPINQLERATGNPAVSLELKNILLVEKKRLEIDAGGQLTSAEDKKSQTRFKDGKTNTEVHSTKDEKQSPTDSEKPDRLAKQEPVKYNNGGGKYEPQLVEKTENNAGSGRNLITPPAPRRTPLVVTNQNGVSIKLFLEGLTSEFNTVVKFVDNTTGYRMDIPLADTFSYWKLGFGTDSSANLDAASIVSMFLKLPPALGGALGTFLQKIGTLNFFVKLKSTQHWIDADAEQVSVPGIGKVSKLSFLLAKDVFAKICRLQNFSDSDCQTKIHKWTKNPVTDQIKSYAVMPIVGCVKQNRYENTIPLYDHYVIVPRVEDEDVDFFNVDPNREELTMNIYRRLSDREWKKTRGMVAAKYGTFTKEVDPSLCYLDDFAKTTKRCMRIKFGSNYYDNRCNQIASGLYAGRTGYSFYSTKIIYLEDD